MLRVSKILMAEAEFKRDARYFMELMESCGFRVVTKESKAGTLYVKVKNRGSEDITIRFSSHGMSPLLDYKFQTVALSVDPQSRKTVGDAVNLVRIHNSAVSYKRKVLDGKHPGTIQIHPGVPRGAGCALAIPNQTSLPGASSRNLHGSPCSIPRRASSYHSADRPSVRWVCKGPVDAWRKFSIKATATPQTAWVGSVFLGFHVHRSDWNLDGWLFRASEDGKEWVFVFAPAERTPGVTLKSWNPPSAYAEGFKVFSPSLLKVSKILTEARKSQNVEYMEKKWTTGCCWEWAFAYYTLKGGELYVCRAYYLPDESDPEDEAYVDSHAFVSMDGGVTGIDSTGMRPVSQILKATDFYHTTNITRKVVESIPESVIKALASQFPDCKFKKFIITTPDKIINNYNEKTSAYSPPMKNIPEHLKKDEVHAWRADTGIELMHKEPTKGEFERIWKNWQQMPAEMKESSDEQSF